MPKSKSNKLPTIIILGLITGTLDALAALIISYPATPERVFRYIASGYFGKEALNGDYMVLWGILFHYVIAFLFSAALLELHPKFKAITKNIYILAIIYGLLIYVVMTFAVLPLTDIPKQPVHVTIRWWPMIKNILALIICLGLPIAFFSERYYIRKSHRSSNRRRRSSAA